MDCFAVMPIEAVNILLFSRQEITAEHVIESLCPVYKDRNDNVFAGNGNQKAVLEVYEEQGKKTVGLLTDILKENGQDFLHGFVRFATGLQYIPRERFQIWVEFNYNQLKDEASLPQSHSCDQILVLPGDAYNGKIETLQKKLQQTVAYMEESLYQMP